MKINLISYYFDQSGFGNYCRHLYQSLRDSNGEFIIHRTEFNYDQRSVKLVADEEQVISRSKPLPLIDNYLLFGLRNRDVVPDDYDIHHILIQSLSYLDVAPKIVTCHDAIPFIHRQGVVRDIIKKVKFRGVKDADHVITISQEAKRQIVEWLDVPTDRISVIYQGIGDEYKPIASLDRERLLNRYGLPRAKYYLLHVGSERPNKNVPFLLEAFSRLVSDIDVHLIKIGEEGDLSTRRLSNRIIKKRGIQQKVSFLGYIDRDDLLRFYNLADLFVFPSLYEGFGRPPLEAMACGTPVIAANVSSLPEVLGDAAKFFDPRDINSLVQVIIDVLENTSLRRDMVSKGLLQAQKFNWQRTMQDTLGVYKRVLEARQ